MLQEHIETSILLLASRHRVKSRSDVVQTFKDMGLMIERTTDTSISFSHKAFKKNFRFKGSLFEKNFKFEHDRREQQVYELGEHQRKSKAVKVWREGMKIKTTYNKALYDTSKPVPLTSNTKSLQFELDVVEPKQIARRRFGW